MKKSILFPLWAGSYLLATLSSQAQFTSATHTATFDLIAAANNSTETTQVEIEGAFLFDADNLWLRVVVENLGINNNGGVITKQGAVTSFGFDTTYGDLDDVQLDNVTHSWVIVSPYDLTPADDYTRDIGVGQTSNVSGGGSPNSGIQVGPNERGEFDFDFSSVNGLTADDFNPLNFFGPEPSNVLSFRVRGIEGTDTEGNKLPGSDKLWGGVIFGDGDVTTPAIPEPSTYGLLGAAFLTVLVLLKRVRNRKATA